MKKLGIVFWLLAASALLITSCQKQPNIMEPQDSTNPNLNGSYSITLPPGATLQSATLSVFVNSPSGATVNVHRITQPWDEMVVTWNSFGGSFDPAIVGSFMPNAADWRSVDVTSLVQGWLNGSYPDYGFLLEQGQTEYTNYYSSDFPVVSMRPKLEICYNMPSGTVCETFQRGLLGTVSDTYIWQLNPDENFGASELFYTGLVSGFEKMSLLKFEYTPPPQEGCTRTIGYWKTHAGFGKGNQGDMVTALLPVWLGTAGGTKSINVTTALIAYNLLTQKVYGDPSNGITKLYSQLLGAKLNIASGTGHSDIDVVIAAADPFLATHNWNDWAGLSPADQQMVLLWQNQLDSYNNGLVGPVHCQ